MVAVALADRVIETRGLTKDYGGVRAVAALDMRADAGAIVGLIGPNGAGKTTVLNLMTGLTPPTSGEVRFGELRLDLRKAHAIAALGIARTFQTPRVFGRMTALDNVVAGMHVRARDGAVGHVLMLPGTRAALAELRDEARATLAAAGLADRALVEARMLSHGEQRRLELARAIASNPKVLLLDEPAAGLNPTESATLRDTLLRLRDEHGLAIVLVEHDMHLVMGACDRIVVLNFGSKIAEGTPAQVRANLDVVAAYLGLEPAS